MPWCVCPLSPVDAQLTPARCILPFFPAPIKSILCPQSHRSLGNPLHPSFSCLNARGSQSAFLTHFRPASSGLILSSHTLVFRVEYRLSATTTFCNQSHSFFFSQNFQIHTKHPQTDSPLGTSNAMPPSFFFSLGNGKTLSK